MQNLSGGTRFKCYPGPFSSVSYNLTANHRPTLNGERFFTDKEVSARLKVSRRTLQDYRNEGRIAYIQLGGKMLYRESDIERMLADSYRSAYRLTGI